MNLRMAKTSNKKREGRLRPRAAHAGSSAGPFRRTELLLTVKQSSCRGGSTGGSIPLEADSNPDSQSQHSLCTHDVNLFLWMSLWYRARRHDVRRLALPIRPHRTPAAKRPRIAALGASDEEQIDTAILNNISACHVSSAAGARRLPLTGKRRLLPLPESDAAASDPWIFKIDPYWAVSIQALNASAAPGGCVSGDRSRPSRKFSDGEIPAVTQLFTPRHGWSEFLQRRTRWAGCGWMCIPTSRLAPAAQPGKR